MPVLLDRDRFAAWLDGSASVDVLQPAAEAAPREWIVTTRLNWTGQGDDDATMIEPEAA